MTDDLGIYIEALTRPLEEIDSLARDTTNGDPGWSIIVDLDRAPSSGLSWLAQFVGVVFKSGLTDAEQREWILAQAGQKRGTVNALIAATQLHLTGTKQVILR